MGIHPVMDATIIVALATGAYALVSSVWSSKLSARLKRLEGGHATALRMNEAAVQEAKVAAQSYLDALVVFEQGARELVDALFEGDDKKERFDELKAQARRLERTVATQELARASLPEHARTLEVFVFQLLWEIREDGPMTHDEDQAERWYRRFGDTCKQARIAAQDWQLDLREERLKFTKEAAAGNA